MSLHVLTIGTNYTGTTSELAGCLNDAKDWAKACRPHAESVTTITGKKATRTNILKQGRKLLDRLEPGDTAWITFSGHGTRVRDRMSTDERTGYDQALVCDDFELIFDDETGELLVDRPEHTLVALFFDCCHSGTPMRNTRRPRFIPLARCKTHRRDRSPYLTRSLKNVLSFSGCGDGPTDYSYDAEFKGRPNGAMTYHALQSLKALRRGSSYRSWFNRLGGRNGALPTEDYPQVPQVHGSAKNLTRVVPLL